MTDKTETYFRNIGIVTRPNANDGLWLMLLLPAAVITSALTNSIVLTPTYKLSSVFCVGLTCSSIVFLYQCLRKEKTSALMLWHVTSTIVTSIIFYFYLHKDFAFSLSSAFLCTFFYHHLSILLLTKFPKCFTIGEGCLISQALVLLLYTTGLNLLNSPGKFFSSNMQISTIIIQLGLLGIGVIALSCYIFNIRKSVPFYILFVLDVFIIIFLPLHIILKQSPLLWIFQLMFYDTSSIKLIIYWSFCCGVAVLAVSNQIFYAKKATTSQRKVFHILAVSVYIPGLLFKCSFLYLATGVVLGIFFMLEILRILNIPPLGHYLQDGYLVFSDEKDAGIVAFTPIYLLAGCSLPLWIHPAPCDLTDSAMFGVLPLLSGLLTIGIGDTAASVIGSRYGSHKWKDSPKSIEGTLACMLSQIAFVLILIYFGGICNVTKVQYIKTAVAIIVTSIVEAKTTQVDNLVLPLIMYIILV